MTKAAAGTGGIVANELANLAYTYVTGPVHVYIRIPRVGVGPYVFPRQLQGKILFLGHFTESPEIEIAPKYLAVHSSLSGPEIPDDEIYIGAAYQVGGELSRFNYSVLMYLKQFPLYGRGAPAGTETFLDRGRLALAQGDTFEIWFKNAFYGTANANAYPDLAPGYYFPACRSVEVLPQKLSRDAKKVHINIKPMSARQGVIGDTVTYSQNPDYFKNLPAPG